MKNLEYWYKKFKKSFLYIIIIGFIVHAFIITNKLINHDELANLFFKGSTYNHGRWGLELITCILPNISMQSLYGFLTIIFVALSACVIFEILNIKNDILQISIGGIMVSFPTITGTFAYMFTASSYGIAIFLSVLFVYFMIKKNLKLNLLGILCLIISLGLYQSYISLSASLLIILLIKDCLNKDKTLKEVIFRAIVFFVSLIIALGIYLIISKILIKFTGIELTDYQNMNTMGQISLYSVVIGIIKSYKAIFDIFISNWNGIAYTGLLKLILGIILFLSMFFIVCDFNKIRKINRLKGFAFLFFIILLPIAMNMTFLLNSECWMHTLMVYGNVILFIFPIVLYEENEEILLHKKSYYIRNLIIILLMIVIFHYAILANACYTKLFLAYENTYAFFNTLSTRIQSTEGFNEDTKIAFIGNYNGEFLNNSEDKFPYTNLVVGIIDAKALIGSYRYTDFLKYYIGIDIKYASQEEIDSVKKLKEYNDMSIYPYENSIKIIDNILIVKYE